MSRIPVRYQAQFREKCDVQDAVVDKFLDAFTITAHQQDVILNVPQRSPAWFKHRVNRVTASNFAAANNNSPYCSRKSLLSRIITPRSFTNAACRWGIDKEAVAATVFENHLKCRLNVDSKITYPGLVINLTYPFLGCSPDGIVHHILPNGTTVLFGLEIKCPYAKKKYGKIPRQYYDQIQGTMGLMGLQYYYFVVWTPDDTEIQLFEFNATYFHNTLLPNLLEFFYLDLVPALMNIQKEDNLPPIDLPMALVLGEEDDDDDGSPPFTNAPMALVL